MIHPKNPNCFECMENDGVLVEMECIDGDEWGVEFECPRCGRVAWVHCGEEVDVATAEDIANAEEVAVMAMVYGVDD